MPPHLTSVSHQASISHYWLTVRCHIMCKCEHLPLCGGLASQRERQKKERGSGSWEMGEALRQRKAQANRVNRQRHQGTRADWLMSQLDILFLNERRLWCNKERCEAAWTQEKRSCHHRRLSKAVWAEDHLAHFHSLLQTHTSLSLLSQSASSTQTCFISLLCVLSQVSHKTS